MSNDVRPVGLGFGLVLGLVLASPWLSPSILPRGIEALFLLSAFLVRLADRRWHRRQGIGGWISHMRMMPSRLLPWAAMAVVAFIARAPGTSAGGVITGAMLSEFLFYPLLSGVIGRAGRSLMAIAILMIMAFVPFIGWEALRYAGAFAMGALLCAFWLRGPDGEPRAAALTIGGTGLLGAVGWAFPATSGWSVIGAVGCATLALAHLSMLRPTIAHWLPHRPIRFRRSRKHPVLP